jgi:hypothetical protein
MIFLAGNHLAHGDGRAGMNNENKEKNNDCGKGDGSGPTGSAKLFLVSSLLLAFTLLSSVTIIAWGPLLPEAVAVNLDRGKTPFSEYVILHESWHSIAASRRAIACEQ